METLEMYPNGDLKLVGGTTRKIVGAECARQRAECDLALFLGEHFLDTTAGVPYYRDILLKNPNLEVVRSALRRVVAAVPGIVSVPRMDAFPPDSDRHALAEFEAVYEDGTPVIGEAPAPTDTFDSTFEEGFL